MTKEEAKEIVFQMQEIAINNSLNCSVFFTEGKHVKMFNITIKIKEIEQSILFSSFPIKVKINRNIDEKDNITLESIETELEFE